jgi:hypothetical protein
MPEEVVLAKSNADTSASLVAYSTPDSFTIAEKGGTKNCILKRVDGPLVAHTAQDKGYVRIAKTVEGTVRKILLLPFKSTMGLAAGEAAIEHGSKPWYDTHMEFKENDVIDVDGQYEVASKDQGCLMHLVYGSVRGPEQFINKPDHWVRHATSAPTVDVWSAGLELNASVNFSCEYSD